MEKQKEIRGLAKLGRRLISTKKKARLKPKFNSAGYHNIPYRGFGQGFIITCILSVAWYIYLLLYSGLLNMGIPFVIASFFVLIVIFEIILLFAGWILLLIYIEVKSYSRVQSIENNLPLFLREFATNLKAGREFVDALEDSLTPQLGVLNDDISAIIVSIRSGVMVEKVLKEYSRRYDSYAINETFEIILDAYSGGGGLAEIIDRIAENLEVIHFLKKSAIASVSNYIIFTSIVSLFIAPILFALSYNLLWLIRSLLDRVILTGSTPGFLDIATRLDISFSDFRLFSRVGIGVISGSAASIIGIIRRGSIRGAPVLILFFVILALVMYEVSFVVLRHFFQVLFKIA